MMSSESDDETSQQEQERTIEEAERPNKEKQTER
jgi:hypothetical protein